MVVTSSLLFNLFTQTISYPAAWVSRASIASMLSAAARVSVELVRVSGPHVPITEIHAIAHAKRMLALGNGRYDC